MALDVVFRPQAEDEALEVQRWSCWRSTDVSIRPAGGVGISLAPGPEQYTPYAWQQTAAAVIMAGHGGERRSPHPIT